MADTDNSRDRGGIHVTNTSGNVTIGDNNTVTSTVNGTQPARDPRQEQLLQAVLRLRADLRGVVATDRTAALDEELSDTADEIEGHGSADAGRLRRLRQALTDAGAVTGILASGVAVGQAVGTLLGG